MRKFELKAKRKFKLREMESKLKELELKGCRESSHIAFRGFNVTKHCL